MWCSVEILLLTGCDLTVFSWVREEECQHLPQRITVRFKALEECLRQGKGSINVIYYHYCGV